MFMRELAADTNSVYSCSEVRSNFQMSRVFYDRIEMKMKGSSINLLATCSRNMGVHYVVQEWYVYIDNTILV
jgi:hypothetical protein